MTGNFLAVGPPAAARRGKGSAAAWMCALALALAPMSASAVVAINGPWVRLAPNGTTAEAYMEIASSEPASLVEVRSTAAAKVTLRSPGKGVVAIAEVPLPAGALVALAPGGPRIGLEQLAHPLKLGDYVPLTVTIRGAGGKLLQIPINAEVRRRSARDDHLRGHAH